MTVSLIEWEDKFSTYRKVKFQLLEVLLPATDNRLPYFIVMRDLGILKGCTEYHTYLLKFRAFVKAPKALIVRLVLSWTEVASEQTSREFLVLLETTQSLLVREEVTLGSFQECWIGNQVKLRAWLSKYGSFIYRQGRAQAMKLKVDRTGQELSIRKVRSGAQTCCGLYEANNRELA